MPHQLVPSSFEEAAAGLAEAARGRHSVKIVGAGSKQGWGRPAGDADVELSTTRLGRVLEHNEGDFTAVLEAGVPLAQAQRQFAAAGQMLALDPFLGSDHHATIGGIIATADSGPLRHRYGAARDLVLGMTVALSDGTIARSGGKVIKNVAGYDLGKLFSGSLGTLGMILSVSVRLHPLPAQTVTALGIAADAAAAAAAAAALTAAPLELEALDIAWRGGRGGILARSAGVQAKRRAERAGTVMREAGLEQVELTDADAELWARQRAGQRSAERALLRVAARPSELAQVLRAADACGATLVGRAAFGHSFIDVDPAELGRLVERLPSGTRRVLLDGPRPFRDTLDPWGDPPAPQTLALMQRIKARFDPAQICNPGVFVGGI
jgi:glycolate oxidase FAD binding subunit